MSWEAGHNSSSILRRRGNAEAVLPVHLNGIEQQKKYARNKLLYTFGIPGATIFFVVLIIFKYSSSKSNLRLDNVIDAKLNEAQIIGKYPLNAEAIQSNTKVNSKIISEAIPNISTQRINSIDIGNVVILSYKGYVGIKNIVDAITKENGFSSSMQIFSRRFWDEGLNLPPMESSIISNPAPQGHKSKIEAYINARLFPLNPQLPKFIEVDVSDAWSNGVTISWLLQALRTHGGVTHIIKISRNPIYVYIDTMSYERSGKTHEQLPCETQRNLYEISATQVSDLAISQGNSFLDVAANTKDLQQLGLSFETDIILNPKVAYNKITEFLKLPPAQSIPILPPPKPLCPLKICLYNYKELQCIFQGSPLQWLVVTDKEDTSSGNIPTSRGALALDFDDGISSTKEYFKSWIEKGQQQVAITKCEAQLIEKTTQIDNLPELDITQNRCAHGGHTDTCRGYGHVSEFVCRRIFLSSDCDIMTFKNGEECYMHMSNKEDFWMGDCEPPSYHAKRKES